MIDNNVWMGLIKNTPMIEQYLDIKAKHKDALLLYRMGDFYEMFFEDAKIASQILEIVLTSRNKNDTKSVPMCGFPYRSVRNYISKLIASGHKVAICDQINDAIKTKGLVKRKVVRVITPGMVVDDDLLDGTSNNYVLAVHYYKECFGIAFLDISTGDFFITELFKYEDLIDEVMRISPSEILVSKKFKKKFLESNNKSFLNIYVSLVDDKNFDYLTCCQLLLNQFNVVSLESFNSDNMVVATSAAGALINYVHETQKQKLTHLKPIKVYFLENFLIIDDKSFKNLEIFKNIKSGLKENTLLSILDNTVTSMGGRLLKNWIRYPLMERKEILKRHSAVNELIKKFEIREKISKFFKFVFDLERLGNKVSIGNINARDLNTLKHSIQILPSIFEVISVLTSELFSCQNLKSLSALHEVSSLINDYIREDAPIVLNEGSLIREGVNSKLDELINIAKNAKNWIANIEIEEKKRTGINSLKLRYNRIFGYYIEISKSHSGSVPNDYIRKQTLANSERYTTDIIKKIETKILNADAERIVLELEIFKEVILKVKNYNHDIQIIANFIAVIDCIVSLALVAHKNGYCKPSFNLDGSIEIEEGRHPVVEKLIEGERFVYNTIKINSTKNQILIITGPNMAGKSTVLRQTALCVIMAQIGSFVPAKKANISIVDRIFTRVGALDNLTAGQSTFMVEMQEMANILNNATVNSLIIIDEIGRGTSTFDGLSIAWAIIEYLHDFKNVGIKSMVATHYHELTELENHKSRVQNFNIDANEINGKVVFIRKLVKGSTNKSYGIQVAGLAGIPNSVIERSKGILIEINNNYDLKVLGSGKNKQEELSNSITDSVGLLKQKKIISMLQKINILKMNPVEALNCLNKLQIEAKDISQKC